MKVFLIDAYDSFVYIIEQYLKILGLKTRTLRNDQPDLIKEIENYKADFLILGPGPGSPEDSGYLKLINHFQGKLPIMGVCLGHQAIGLAAGCKIKCAKHIMHGKVSTVSNDGKGVFSYNKGQDIQATRYHSLIIDEENPISDDLIITARSKDDGYIMGVRHKKYAMEGVQFHPESILTTNGINIFKSFIKTYL